MRRESSEAVKLMTCQCPFQLTSLSGIGRAHIGAKWCSLFVPSEGKVVEEFYQDATVQCVALVVCAAWEAWWLFGRLVWTVFVVCMRGKRWCAGSGVGIAMESSVMHRSGCRFWALLPSPFGR